MQCTTLAVCCCGRLRHHVVRQLPQSVTRVCLALRQEALQRNHHGGSGGTLSMVEHNMAASPGFQPPSPAFQPSSPGFPPSSQHQGSFRPHQPGFQQQQQQAPSRQQVQQGLGPQHQQRPQPEQRRPGFDGSRLPDPPEGMQKLRCACRCTVAERHQRQWPVVAICSSASQLRKESLSACRLSCRLSSHS